MVHGVDEANRQGDEAAGSAAQKQKDERTNPVQSTPDVTTTQVCIFL